LQSSSTTVTLKPNFSHQSRVNHSNTIVHSSNFNMKFSTSIIILALGLMTAATPLIEERDPEAIAAAVADVDDVSDVSPVSDAADHAPINQPGCKKGTFNLFALTFTSRAILI
jgi:hypothetical protein